MENNEENKVTTNSLKNNKRFFIPSLITLFVCLFCAAVVSALQKNEKTMLLLLVLVVYALTLIASIVLTLIIRFRIKDNANSSSTYRYINISFVAISYLLDMAFFRIWIIVKPDSIFNKAGLFSVIVSVIAILLIVAASFIKLEYVSKFISFFTSKFKKKNN